MQNYKFLLYLFMSSILYFMGCPTQRADVLPNKPVKHIANRNLTATSTDNAKLMVEGNSQKNNLDNIKEIDPSHNVTKSKFVLFEHIIPILILLVAFCALVVRRKQLRTLKWNQINNTFDLVKIWFGPHMTDVRIRARQYFNYESLEPVKVEDITKLENYPEISQLFATLLNYFEMVSLAYLKKAVDQGIIYNYFAYSLVNHYLIFKPYIEYLRTKLDPKNASDQLKTIGHMEIVAERWIKQKRVAEMKRDSRYKAIERNPIYKGK